MNDAEHRTLMWIAVVLLVVAVVLEWKLYMASLDRIAALEAWVQGVEAPIRQVLTWLRIK